jgi:LPS-assembly protein
LTKRLSIYAVFLLLIGLLPVTGYGQGKLFPGTGSRSSGKGLTGPIDISARELNYNRETNVYTAEGDVELKEGTRHLSADFVEFNDTTKDAVAVGHVVLRDQGDVVEAERMTVNLVTQQGTIEKGRIFVTQGNFSMTGEEIKKTGEATYVVHQGEFTTCGWDRPAWTFKAKDIALTVNGYATAKQATFSILGRRVLYVPWGIFPVKTERQSGFLLPEFQLSSRDGTIFRTAYFWAISQDQDATAYLDWIQNRGIKPGAEYRYHFKPDLKGSWYVSGIKDNDYDRTRFQIKGRHEQMFGDMSFKADIDHVSDPDYLKDLSRKVIERSESSLRSTAFVEKPFSRSLLTVQTSYYNSLAQRDNSATFRYLPAASYSTEYMPLGKSKLFLTDIAADFTNFSRDTGDKFTRMTLEPRIRIPYSINGVNLLLTGAFTEKAYAIDPASPRGDNTEHHESFRVEGDANMRFVKNSHVSLFDLGETQSIIMPRARYTFLDNLQSISTVPSIEPSDKLANTNTVTYSFNHYFNAIKEGVVREISLLEVEQTYGLSGNLEPAPNLLYEGSGNRFSDVVARLTLYPSRNLWYVHQETFNTHGEGFSIIRNTVHYAYLPYYQIDLAHNYNKGLVNELWTNMNGKWRIFDGRYQIRYSLKDEEWVDMLASLTYRPQCWGVTLSLLRTKRPNDTSFHLSFNLQGITQNIGGN